ncbi:sequestosome-1-like isoform X2 [Ostrea edulis]|uniref:sequestosome-1-like isoform X2 n=1 Tax=Ostrea edulis TaxID=37623 RepID=UPI0024AED90C|nr:sequestosome-1-like isoform X2 [Ostrea edulis]
MADRTVKVHLMRGGREISEIRRFSYPSTTTFNQLYERIKAVFPELQNKTFSLQWQDDDGDFVSFSSNEEMSEFTKNAVDGCLKIYARGNADQRVSESADRFENVDVTNESTENNKESIDIDKEVERVDQSNAKSEQNTKPENQLEENTVTECETSETFISDPCNEIEEALQQMMSMGFHNEGGWLLRLLQEKDGHIEEVLENILIEETPQRTRRQKEQGTVPGTCGGCHSKSMTYSSSGFPESSNLFQHIFQHLRVYFVEEGEDIRSERSNQLLDLGKDSIRILGNLAEPKHCFSKPEYTKATDEREPTTQTENEDSKESVPERNEKSDEDVDGPAAGTDSSKNDGHWTFVEDEIPQTRAESNPEERTESKSYQANSPLTAENSRGFQVEDPPSGLDPRIDESLTQMMSMGFHNDGGWLQCLLRENHGSIDKVLDIVQKSVKENK